MEDIEILLVLIAAPLVCRSCRLNNLFSFSTILQEINFSFLDTIVPGKISFHSERTKSLLQNYNDFPFPREKKTATYYLKCSKTLVENVPRSSGSQKRVDHPSPKTPSLVIPLDLQKAEKNNL